MMINKVTLLICLLIFAISISAQEKPILSKVDSVNVDSILIAQQSEGFYSQEFKESVHQFLTNKHNRNPKRAVILSAILPGAGQLYNRQYYKVPIMYGAIGGVMYLFDNRISNYRSYKRAYELSVANRVNEYPNLSQSQLKINRDNARSKLEKTYLIAAGVYAYIVIDAYVSAHLSDFDVSDDISFRIIPQDNMVTNSIVGMGIGMKLRLD